MGNHAEFRIKVDWEKTGGKFAPREEIVDAIREELESANPGNIDSIGADGDSDYEITEWEVDEIETVKVRKR